MTGLSPSTDQANSLPHGGNDATRVAQLCEMVLADIGSGRLAPGARLPSIRRTAAERSMSRDTVLRAYDRLVAHGHVRPVRGSGFYVLGAKAVTGRTEPAGEPMEWQRLIHSALPFDRSPGSGAIRHEPNARAEVQRMVRTTMAAGLATLSGYGDPLGYLPLREQLQQRLAQAGLACSTDHIVTTPGATAALTVIARALVKSGSTVLIEDPAPFIHRQVLLSQGALIETIPRRADGPDLDALRAACARHRPALFLLSSVMQNPTGSSLSRAKAFALLAAAESLGLTLVDDNSFGDFHAPDMPPVAGPLLLSDALRRVIHVGGFSRMLEPSVGVGYIVAGESSMQWLRDFRAIHGLGHMILGERITYRFLSEGLYRRRCERVRTAIAAHGARVIADLRAIGLAPDRYAGGAFLWVPLGEDIDAEHVARRMFERRYLTAPGRHFSYAPAWRSHMRFNVTATTPAAVEALAQAVGGG